MQSSYLRRTNRPDNRQLEGAWAGLTFAATQINALKCCCYSVIVDFHSILLLAFLLATSSLPSVEIFLMKKVTIHQLRSMTRNLFQLLGLWLHDDGVVTELEIVNCIPKQSHVAWHLLPLVSNNPYRAHHFQPPWGCLSGNVVAWLKAWSVHEEWVFW